MMRSEESGSAAPDRGIPGPKGYPLIGALPEMRKDPLRFLVEAARRYGDVVHLGGFGRQQFYLVNNPADLEYIHKANHKNYVKGANFELLKSFVGEGLFLAENDYWRRQRRLLQPAFHVSRIAALGELIGESSAALTERWAAHAKRGEPVEVEREMMHLSLTIAVATLFGASLGAERVEAVRRAVRTAFRYLHERVWAVVRAPLWVPTPANREYARAVRTLDRIVYDLLAERRASPREGDDMLSMLLAVCDEETGERMTDRQIRDEILTFLVAGHESTALTLTWTLFLVSRHPLIEQRLHAELDSVLGGRVPGYADLPRLPYTAMLLKESMRLYPAFWMSTRTPLADDELSGHRIEAGSILVLCPYAMHRHPRYWRNPEGVDPERFTPERSASRPAFAYYPFGHGPRQCIGQRLAEFQTLVTLAVVSSRYSLHLLPGHPVEPQATISLRPRHGMPMTLEERRALAAPGAESNLAYA